MKPTAHFSTQDVIAFRADLLKWYRANRRDLPWRRTNDPYKIWLSEIMLQQTRVAAVFEHYDRFLKRFPTVQKLAAAKEPSVLALWSGLGYYRRARNLQAAARVVVREHSGEFPSTAAKLRSLAGIGRYSAAAVASIAFGEPVAVVDGNVERVISRLLGKFVSGENLWATANEILCPENPGDFNQAMMELGATVCLPAEPSCTSCPVHAYCRTRGRHESLRKNPRQFKREIVYALQRDGNSTLLVKRAKNERLMPSMWELPQIRLRKGDEQLFSVRHSITVTDFTVRVIGRSDALAGTWVKDSRLKTLALTGLTKKILSRAGIIQLRKARPQ